MAGGASFAQRRMLENEGAGLLPVALRTRFVLPGHRQTPGRFHDIHPMRIVALRAIHLPFRHGMMLWKMEFRIDLQMALITSLWVFAGIDDKLFASGASHRDVFAGRSVARFASVGSWHFAGVKMESRVRAGRKCARNVGVAIEANLVAYEGRSFDHRGRNERALGGRAGADQQPEHSDACKQTQARHGARESQV